MPGGDAETLDNPGKPSILGRYVLNSRYRVVLNCMKLLLERYNHHIVALLHAAKGDNYTSTLF